MIGRLLTPTAALEDGGRFLPEEKALASLRAAGTGRRLFVVGARQTDTEVKSKAPACFPVVCERGPYGL